ncbi:F-box domain containing protein [Tanacetum coccineum]|uniref:F-box domain containing protein n=1 Tax=Tanacetum coccineum TaxID=301880 RepID=A0ABQ4ZP11_9ASTR
MSAYIPFEIQSEIIKNLPVQSLLQFRCVSKQWKSLIDSSEFIKNYHINRPRHHFLVWDKLGDVRTCTSIIDDNTFPQQKFPFTAPESLNSIRYASLLGSVNGLLCFYRSYGDVGFADIWNPSIRKSVNILIPNVLKDTNGDRYTVIGFGVCPDDTSDPKLVKINVNATYTWVVEVFTLSTRVWQTVYRGTPFKSCALTADQVFIDGIIYWQSVGLDEGLWPNYIISFDLKREKFGEVSLSERLSRAENLEVAKVNESLGLLEYYIDGFRNNVKLYAMKDDNDKGYALKFIETIMGHLIEFLSSLIFAYDDGALLQGLGLSCSYHIQLDSKPTELMPTALNGFQGCKLGQILIVLSSIWMASRFP